MMNKQTEKIVLSGLFIAIGIILAPIFHSAGLGQSISPIHFPVLIAGIIVGWKYGLAIGLITPLLSSLMPFGMPLFPVATTMAVELAIYGLTIGFVYEKLKPFKERIFNIYLALIIAMVAGRLAGGITNVLILGIQGDSFTLNAFLTGYFVATLPGIVLQILIIPAIIEIYETKLEKRN